MTFEGPYRPQAQPLPWVAIGAWNVVISLGVLGTVLCLWPEPAAVHEERVLIKTPSGLDHALVADLRADVAANGENLDVLAKRLEQPAVYRYLDPRPLRLRASRFADAGDQLTGSSSACKLPEDYRRVLPTDFVYAHRDWPCHQLAEICYRGKCIHAIKATSGPFGCTLAKGVEPFETCRENGWCWTTQAREDCPYRGQIDIGAAVAEALGMDGIKTVRVRRIGPVEE